MKIQISVMHEKCFNEWNEQGNKGPAPYYQTITGYDEVNSHCEDLVCQRCGDQIQMWTEITFEEKEVKVDA